MPRILGIFGAKVSDDEFLVLMRLARSGLKRIPWLQATKHPCRSSSHKNKREARARPIGSRPSFSGETKELDLSAQLHLIITKPRERTMRDKAVRSMEGGPEVVVIQDGRYGHYGRLKGNAQLQFSLVAFL